MIPREYIKKYAFVIIAIIHVVRSENSRVYDTNEWVPIDRSCPTCERSPRNQQNTDKQPNDRVLNVNEKLGQPIEKISNYLPSRHLPKRQQLFNPNAPRNIRQQLNEGEIVNQQFYKPQINQHVPLNNREYPAQLPQILQNSNQQPQPIFPPQLLPPPEQQFFLQNQQFIPPPLIPNPGNINYFQRNYNNFPVANPPKYNLKNQSLPFGFLNPGIDIINQELASGPLANNNNYNNLIQLTKPVPPNPQAGNENVQLVYVPIESLNQKQQQTNQQIKFAAPEELPKQQQHRFQQNLQFNPQNQLNAQNNNQFSFPQAASIQNNLRPQSLPLTQERLQPLETSQMIPNRHIKQPSINQNESPSEHKQHQLQNIQNDFARQALDALKLQLSFDQGETQPQVQVTSTTTPQTLTNQSKKRKPHQPPLAVYMGGEGDVSVSDVLNLLKNAKTISVQDEVGPNSPQVFVGPNNLEAPDGFTKFELPYLNTVESNRIERKVEQLPFFVAPANYNAPSGYSKIPLPAPHVGSVVISDSERQTQQLVQQQQQQQQQPPQFSFGHTFNNNYQTPISYQNRQPYPIRNDNVNQAPRKTPDQTISNSYRNPLANNPSQIQYSSTIRPDPLGQTINQYELEQINNQFVPQFLEHNQSEFQLTDEEIDKYVQNNYNNRNINNRSLLSNHQYITEVVPTTTELPKLPSHRGRPAHRLQASTQSVVEKDKYTILEDFSVNDDNVKPTTQQSYVKSLVQPSQTPMREFRPTVIPESNHFDIQFRPNPDKIEYQQPPQLHQPIAAELIQSNPIPNQYQNENTYFQLTNNGQYVPVENINQNSFRPIQQDYRQEIKTEKPSDSFTTPTTFNLVNIPTTESVTQNVERTTSATNKLRSRGKVHHVPQTYNDPSEDFNNNGENYKLSDELPSINPNLHNLINNLQDQSLRPLLVPASIAPTTEHISFSSPIQQPKLPNQYEELAPIQYQPTKPPHQYEEIAPIQHQPTNLPTQYEELAPIQHQSPKLPTQYEELAPIQHHSTKLPTQYEEIAPIQHQSPYTIVSPPEVQSTSALPITRFLSTTTESTPIETTTPYKRPRGRRTRVTTTTYSPPVRSSQRTRRPSSRARPPQIKQQSEEVDYSSTKFNNQARDYENDYTPKVTRRPSTQQRYRSRGRPVQEVEVTQRTTTITPTENDYITQSSLQSRVQLSSTSYQQPQSYMQFEQPMESAVQSKLTYSNENNNNPIQSTEKQYYTSESLSSSNPAGTNQQQLSVDVLINHPVVDSNIKELPRPNNIQYEQLNIQNEPSTSTDFIVEKSSSTTRSHFRRGGRVRVKPKTTTPIPTTSTRYEKPVVNEKDEEFYGFIRTPNFNKPKHIQAQSKSSTNEPKLYSSTYVSTTRRPLLVPVGNGEPIQYENEPKYSNDVQIHPNSFASSTPNIQFVGKIKPKYVLTTPLINDDTISSTTEYVPDRRYSVHTTQSTSTFKPKVRARMRIPNKKLYSQRGSSHFKPPTSVKNNSEDEDVEGGNYPVPYLKGQDINTEKPKFQITIDPDDQIPYSSIYRPQFVKSFDKQNSVVMERKVIESQESQSNEYDDNLKKEKNLSTNANKSEENSLREFTNVVNSTEETKSATVTTLPIDTTTLSESEEAIELTTTTTERERRRGMWRLVKRPIDPLEGSESQNIGSIIANNFILDPQKSKNTDKFDLVSRPKDEPLLDENDKSVVKKSEAPIEITTIPSSDIKKSNTYDNITSQPKQENILHSILNMFGLENNDDQKLSLKNIEDINKEFNSVEITSIDEDFTTPLSEATTLPVVDNNKSSEVETKFPNSDSTILTKTEATDETESNSFENPSNKIQIKTLKSDLLDANLLHQTTIRAETQTPNFEAIKTSISTEVSHETEICYRGKCIKTKGIKKAHAL